MLRSPRARLAAAVLGVTLVGAGCANTHASPPVEFPPNAAPSRIVDAQGRLITTIAEEQRRSIPLAEVPVVMQQAMIAIEDARFWTHRGIDARAILRAAQANLEADRIAEGGSTITQQYVKNALLDDDRTIARKLEEATTALALERAYSKEVILEQYLNTIYFGAGAYGVDAAAMNYFGIPAADLALHQSALLAGLVQAPARYDPRRNPEPALERRNLVLERMEAQGFITPEQQFAAASQPLGVTETPPEDLTSGYPAAHFVEEVKRWLLTESDAIGSSQAERYNNLVRGGLTITTTVDLDVQALAEEAIADVLPDQGSDPRTPDAALTAIEPTSGRVVAMVGGHDFWGEHTYAKANLATGAGRQTGSAFKPIVLATALSEGVPATKVFPAPSSATFNPPGGGPPWRVKGGGIGAGNMADCTVVSSNTCYANIILDDAVGPERSIEMARRLGLTSVPLTANYAAVLGTNNATVRDMSSAYGTFANGGVHVPPVYVTKVERADGTVLYEHRHAQYKVLEPEVARTVNDILPGVIQAGNGTGRRAAIGWPAGGKTGSAQNNTDAWFVGYTAQLSTAVWVGFAEPRPGSDGRSRLVSMTSPNTRITVFGGTYPAQIWAGFMSSALEGQAPLPLNPPEPPPTTTTAAPGDPAIMAPVTTVGTATVPDVVGMTAERARSTLRNAGFDASVVEVDLGEDAAPGRTVTQAPAAGASARSGATVWLEVTVGSPASRTPVPDLRGYGANQATELLESLGFTVEARIVAPPTGSVGPNGSPYVGGQVWRSVPAAGELAPDGQVVIEWTPESASPQSASPPTTTNDD